MKPFQFFLISFFATAQVLFAQEVPQLKIDDEKGIRLSKLFITSEIVNDYAVTTYDMSFYNDTNRTLEGDLVFPLAEGQFVSGFAMEVNGALRSAVVVEKVLAQRAFENAVRQTIDPGLLEKTEGNNYRARIYPILPNAPKRVVVTYEEKLSKKGEDLTFQIPLTFGQKVDDVSINIDVLGASKTPVFEYNALKNYVFSKTNKGHNFKVEKTNAVLNENLTIRIPVSNTQDQLLTYDDYFLFKTKVDREKRLRKKANEITLLYDTSLSLRNRNVDQEFKLLESYFQYLSRVKVRLVSFSNEVKHDKVYTIKNGDWSALKTTLKNLPNDGGTSFKCLEDIRVKGDAVLLFSDGLANLGAIENQARIPVFAVNSMSKGDHEYLQRLSKTGGEYINLKKWNYLDGLDDLKYEEVKLLNLETANNLYDTYTIANGNYYTVVGKWKESGGIMVLDFGYDRKTLGGRTVQISKKPGAEIIKKIWAQEKLKTLNKNKKENKKEIIALAQEHNLLTDYTSLIILDRVEDYAQYRIVPPDELKEAYFDLVKELERREKEVTLENEERKEALKSDYEDLLDWYETTFKKPVQRPNSRPTQTPTFTIEEGTVGGIVSDLSGPLPGVNIIVQGTSVGTQTDFDGKYSISATAGQRVEFSYIGFDTKVIEVGSQNRVDILFEESEDDLEEVIVTAQGIKRESKALGYAVSVVSSNQLESRPEAEVSRVLMGRASGVQITEEDATSDDAIQSNGMRSDLKVWNPDTPYLKLLEKETSVAEAYRKYLEIRSEYINTPSFFIDVAMFFQKKNDNEKAVRVATNLMELDLGNYFLMRALIL